MTATSDPLKEQVDRLICEDCFITQRQIVGIIVILQECVGHIIASLGYWKVCALCVPCMLTPEMKAWGLEICQEFCCITKMKVMNISMQL